MLNDFTQVKVIRVADPDRLEVETNKMANLIRADSEILYIDTVPIIATVGYKVVFTYRKVGGGEDVRR